MDISICEGTIGMRCSQRGYSPGGKGTVRFSQFAGGHKAKGKQQTRKQQRAPSRP